MPSVTSRRAGYQNKQRVDVSCGLSKVNITPLCRKGKKYFHVKVVENGLNVETTLTLKTTLTRLKICIFGRRRRQVTSCTTDHFLHHRSLQKRFLSAVSRSSALFHLKVVRVCVRIPAITLASRTSARTPSPAPGRRTTPSILMPCDRSRLWRNFLPHQY